MTLLIVDNCTHNKTFSIYDKPNGSVKTLIDKGFTPNPKVHDESYPETDGSLAGPSSAGQTPSPPFFTPESESEGPSVIFGKDLVID